MPVPVSSELWIFLWSICGGIVIGFIFDIFRIKRRVIKTGIILVTFEDLLYWVFAALLLFLIVYVSNDGQIRGFTILGCLLGAIFYMSAISPIVLKVSVTVINALIRAFVFTFNVVLWPIKMIVRITKRPLALIKRCILAASGKCAHSVKSGTKSLYGRGVNKLKKHKGNKSIKNDNNL